MYMEKKRGLIRLLGLILVVIVINILFVQIVWGVSIGVSPGRIKFDNMLKDGYAEQTVTVSTSIDEIVTGHYEIKGEIADWIQFEPNEESFSMSKSEPYKVKIIATPPGDVAVGTYGGTITFVTDHLGSVSTGMGSVVRAAVISRTEIIITDKQIVGCRVGGVDIEDVEEGFPIELKFTFQNMGNVRLRPVVSVDIWDQMQKNLVLSKEFVGEEALPTTKKVYVFTIDDELEIGQYWVDVVIRSQDENNEECLTHQLLTFSVFERGAIVDNGVLEKVFGKVWAFVGEIIPITATFRNTGERSVDAKFTGKVVLDDKIVELLESDELRVAPGDSIELESFFNPNNPGRYVVTGRVLYNNKLTFEKGTIVNVRAPLEFDGIKVLPVLVYVIIRVIIVFLIYRIRKERKAHKWKRKR